MGVSMLVVLLVIVLVFVAVPVLIVVGIVKSTRTKTNKEVQMYVKNDERSQGTKFCSNCGAEIHINAVVCVKCGCSVRHGCANEDIPSAGLNVLAFFFPIIGLILYIIFNQTAPIKAKDIGKWALVGFVVSVCLSLVAFISLAIA